MKKKVVPQFSRLVYIRIPLLYLLAPPPPAPYISKALIILRFFELLYHQQRAILNEY